MTLNLWPADVVLIRTSSKLGRAVRWATREPGEEPTVVNHAGCVLEGGELETADVVEALAHGVVQRPLWASYADTDAAVAIYRPVNIGPGQRRAIAGVLEDAVGQRYGRWRLALHLGRRLPVIRRLLDWLTPLDVRRQEWVCSYLVAAAYDAAGLDFGVDRRWATPDDIWDFCQTRTDAYELVFPLGSLTRSRVHATT